MDKKLRKEMITAVSATIEDMLGSDEAVQRLISQHIRGCVETCIEATRVQEAFSQFLAQIGEVKKIFEPCHQRVAASREALDFDFAGRKSMPENFPADYLARYTADLEKGIDCATRELGVPSKILNRIETDARTLFAPASNPVGSKETCIVTMLRADVVAHDVMTRISSWQEIVQVLASTANDLSERVNLFLKLPLAFLVNAVESKTGIDETILVEVNKFLAVLQLKVILPSELNKLGGPGNVSKRFGAKVSFDHVDSGGAPRTYKIIRPGVLDLSRERDQLFTGMQLQSISFR